jgi:ubiquinone/menaquinone biosynthesis C-methylase UbiE
MNPNSRAGAQLGAHSGMEHTRPITAACRPPCLPVEEGYRRWAPIYDSTPNPILALEERYLMPLLPSVRGKRILDLACGTGRWLQILVNMEPSLGVGIDLSTAMLAVAQRKASLDGILAKADCTRLPFRGQCFDLVVFSFALGHVADIGRMIKELARVMNPDADLYVSDIHPQAYDNGWRTGFRDETGAAEIEQSPRSLTSIRERFGSAGFSSVQTLPCVFGKPERPILDRAGKGERFDSLRQVPAIYVCHFKLNAKPTLVEEIQ